MKLFKLLIISSLLIFACAKKKVVKIGSISEPHIEVEEIKDGAKFGEKKFNSSIPPIFLNEKIYFDFDRSNIRADQVEILDGIILILRNHPGISLILEGSTCEIGTDEYNYKLGLRRAKSTYTYLKQYLKNDIECTSIGENNSLAREPSTYKKARNCTIKTE